MKAKDDTEEEGSGNAEMVIATLASFDGEKEDRQEQSNDDSSSDDSDSSSSSSDEKDLALALINGANS